MSGNLQIFFALSLVFATLVALAGMYCILVSRNLIRILIGLELLTKAVTLLLAVAGYATGRMAQAQAWILTLIVVEVVVIAIAAGVVIGAYRRTGDIDARKLQNLKG